MARAIGLLGDLLVLSMLVASAGTARAQTCFTDTAAADFAAGGGCYAAQTADGELILPPTVGAEFSDSSLPADWGSFQWTPPSGTVTVAGGSVTVNGAVARTNGSYLPGSSGISLEFVATFTAQGFQHVGFGAASDADLFNTSPWAIFSTKDGTQVWARTWNGIDPMVDVAVGGSGFCTNGCLGEAHRYRIDWTASGVEFFIDGHSVSQQGTVITSSMRPAISDLDPNDPALSVDWLRMTPYGTPCTFESRTFDGGNAGADWTTFAATIPLPGTGVVLETRTGDTDPTSGPYQLVSGGMIASPKGRYLQYKVTLSTTDVNQTPELDAAQVCFTPCTPGTEVCNGVDDNCDGQIDENFPDLGHSCTVGVGECQATGTTICSDDHSTTVCSATPGSPSPEVCDGLDNDCDGMADNGDPGGNQACNTGNQGICAAGTTHCQSGHIMCAQLNQPTTETCNGLDDNCNGQVDENDPGSGGSCNTGGMGVCAAGTDHCVSGHVTCVPNTAPSAEICDGLDNNCNGQVDENDPGGGGSCSTGQQGVCSAGTQHCQAGGLTCVRNTGPSNEICDGLDNNCNGQTDEGDPGSGAACNTGQQGVCAAGTKHCQGGGLACLRNTAPSTEVCNGLDDDCNGTVDNGDPGGGASCNTGMPGVCGPGVRHCVSGNVTCEPNLSSTPEVCNGLDDNCNGQVDEGNPGGGGACSTGELGVCSAGTFQCQSGSLSCVRTTGPSAEICNSGADENCDGNVDELSDCVLCPPANTVANGFQTKKTKVRLKLLPANDKLQTQGTFVLPTPNSLAPDTNAVSVGLNDGAGFYYEATIPAGSFKRSGSGRQFSFTDRTGVHGGITSAKFSLKGDGVTVKYTIKAGRLDEPAFTAGTGAATIQVGTECFSDTADTCTVSGNGTNALCK